MLKVTTTQDGITIDSTYVTVDNAEITIDESARYLIVPFRFYKEQVTFKLVDEMKDKEVYSEELPAINNNNGTLTIRFIPEVKPWQSFEAKIVDHTDNDRLIWRGKIFVTDQSDLQNFDINKNQ